MASIFEELDTESQEATAPAEDSGNALDAARSGYIAALRQKAVALAEDNNFDLNGADIRFSTALNLSRVRNALVAIVGAGGLGNWQWRILAAMGFKRIAVYDDDIVGIENVGPQAHSIFDIGMPKVAAVADAALAYRGIQIIARNRRVATLSDIAEDLGEVPDIVIGCTDSAEFRNGFITDMFNRLFNSMRTDFKQFPELFLDYRMALGDWVAYIIPMRSMCVQLGHAPTFSRFYNWYRGEAVFSQEEAVQEPCTERAIAYTGANVASFTGSVLHWLYSGGRAKLHDQEYLLRFLAGDATWPARRVSFSSRDFEFISETRTEQKLRAKIRKLKAEKDKPYEALFAAYGLTGCSSLDSGLTIEDSDALCRQYCGNYAVLLKSGKVQLLCEAGALDVSIYGPGHDFDLAGEMHDLENEPYIIVSPAADDRFVGVLYMASKPVGSIFKRDWNGRYYRLVRDGIEGLLDGEVTKVGFADGFLAHSHMTFVDDPEELMAVRLAFSGRDQESRVEFRTVTAADLRVGMWITLSDDQEAERLQVITIGQHVRVRDGDEEYNLSRRSAQHMFEVRVVESSVEDAA